MLPQVLVVDDDDAVRAVIAQLLREAGIEARCARDGGEALEMLQAGQVPDLLLLDLAMPNVDGWHVLAALGEDVRLRALPVIVMTSFASPEDLPAGVPSAHKPVDPDLLLEMVRVQLGARESSPPRRSAPARRARTVSHR
jgi:CheY-like chemotaxis protein